MKKLLCIILSTVILCTSLVGCGENADPSQNLDGGAGLTNEQKQADVEYLMNMLSENYVYQDIKPQSPSVLFQSEMPKCKSTMKKIVNTKSDLEYIQELYSFFDSLECIHTSIYLDTLHYADLTEPFCSFKEYSEQLEKWSDLLGDSFYNGKIPEFHTEFFGNKKVAYMFLPAMLDDYKDDMGIFFEKTNDYENIIVDVRGNQGGRTRIADILSRYLTATSEETMALSNFKYKGYGVGIKGIMGVEHLKQAPIWINPIKAYYGDIDTNRYDVFEISRSLINFDVKPYEGDIYVLQNKGCYSATGLVLQDINSGNFEVTTVGENSGAAGAAGYKMIMLPHSKLLILMPLLMLIDENGGIDEIDGIAPDYLVEPASAEVMAKFYSENSNGDFSTSEYDPQFMKVMELIEQAGK